VVSCCVISQLWGACRLTRDGSGLWALELARAIHSYFEIISSPSQNSIIDWLLRPEARNLAGSKRDATTIFPEVAERRSLAGGCTAMRGRCLDFEFAVNWQRGWKQGWARLVH
jgi:hypothetical protein